MASSSHGLESDFANISPDPEAPYLKPIRRFIPPSWKTFFQRWKQQPWRENSFLTFSPEVISHSPPASPSLECHQRTIFGREESLGISDKDEEDVKEPLPPSVTPPKSGKTGLSPTSQGGLSTAPPSYEEKLEAYDRKYSYMKSWPGLLRLMGGLELILGGMVFACTAAYIQKDYQWSAVYRDSFMPYNGLTGYGYNYYGPMTPFVLVVASLAWLVTVILLGLGVTMYYRTILLHSHWWPLAEFGLNLLMFLLYMAASIAYVNDVSRGGLCYSFYAYNPLIAALCRVEGGQIAAIAFLFLTTLLYLAGSLVCLKMWKHEAARRTEMVVARPYNEELLQKPILVQVAPETHLSESCHDSPPAGKVTRRVEFSEKVEAPETLSCAIPTGHTPKPHIVPDYLLKYPSIKTAEEREKYKAVFNDQYAEYKELHGEVQTALRKFKELQAMMSKLPHRSLDLEDQGRVSAVWREYKSKKKDPAFLEKQERCAYLARKLAHLKAQIQAYDRETSEEGSIYF
ncbi:MARVEL domain-containing protein 2-like [Sceloporus undulatus]|uniref:MARVEL domain-containing protein 2-like n=1 Tax=Sceloporus undulatus TaxID=8520 RepID=UPI001C4D5457|nr:MARVEL domain-containing protein 2-like [Sceloporus undulatus]XP_042335865.1 MARVEL domain-containing protein 2-like [Sceloporus undulatus]